MCIRDRVRFGIPESVRWLENHDRDAEAERSVRVFEDAAGVAPVETLSLIHI